MRVVYAVLISAVVFAAAGCGGADVGAGGASAAPMLKPGALVYWESVSDPGSGQWQQVEDLLGRFPDGDMWIARLKRELERQGADWETEIKPALGETTAVAVYPKSGGQSPWVVGLTNPDDPDKTVALVKKLDQRDSSTPSVTRVVDGWVVISDSEAAIDAALKAGGGGSLADDNGFKSALGKLPEDALTHLYADPAAALETLGSANQDAAGGLRVLGFDRLDFAGAWAKAKDNGAEVAVVLGGGGAASLLGTGEPYASALLDRVPEDAFAFISFQGRPVTKQVTELQNNPLYAMGFREFESQLGVKVADLVALFDGEVAFYARTAAPIPELTLLLDSDNAEQSRLSAARLVRTLAEQSGGEVTEDGDVTAATFGQFAVHVTSFENVVVLSTSRKGIADLQESGSKLPDSDRYKAALEAAGVPGEYTGLTYVDLAEALELLRGYLGFAGGSSQLPPQVARNLEPLKSLVAWGALDGEVASAQAFVEID